MPGKFNKQKVQAAVRGPLAAEADPSGRTALGHPGYARDEKSALFMLGVSNFVGEDTHHENAMTRDGRFRDLIRQVGLADYDWMRGFLPWLRLEGNMRSAPVLAAAEVVRARSVARQAPYGRFLLDGVLQRGDEPGEAWAYWLANYGRKAPHAFQRGIADGVFRLYTERALLRDDSAEAALRFGDVIELSRPRYNREAYGTWRDHLYRYAIMTRHGRDITDRVHSSPDAAMLEHLPVIAAARRIFAMPREERRAFLVSPGGAQRIADAGIKWEAVSGWLQGPMDAAAWQACIPSMGYMALLRNLRNFDQAGVPDEVAEQVAMRLSAPEAVANSRQFPFRFLAAYRAAASLRWAYPLERALNQSLSHVPALSGYTLILVDRSLSMWEKNMSKRSKMNWADGAAIFGAALAVRAQHADLVEFSGRSGAVPFSRGESVLKVVERFGKGDGSGRLESGTDIPSAVVSHLHGHDRVVIITDEQTRAGLLPSNMHGYGRGGRAPTEIDKLIPKDTPVYMWNLAGYTYGAIPTGPTRHLLAGLGDGAFTQMSLLERGRDAPWPFEVPAPDQPVRPVVRTARPAQDLRA